MLQVMHMTRLKHTTKFHNNIKEAAFYRSSVQIPVKRAFCPP